MKKKSRIKLPKQWDYWIQRAPGLRLFSTSPAFFRSYATFQIMSFYGRNRVFRVNDKGQLQCSCPVEHFDRWANSVGASIDKIPSTEKEFLEAIDFLVKSTVDAK